MYWVDAQDTLLKTLLDRSRIGLVTDVDGTISVIADHPDAAQVTPRARTLLGALAERLPLVAAVSGRAVADLQARVGLGQLVYVGNHGLEWWVDDRVEVAPAVAAYRSVLEDARAEIQGYVVPGMIVEDKGATLSVHYRRTADPEVVAATLRPVIGQIAAAHGLRLYEGRMVFELRPPLEIDKGSAFRDLVTRYRLDGAVYLGDDTTDADALQAARAMRAAGTCYALGLGVESDSMPEVVRASADLIVNGVQDAERFLAWMLNASVASSNC